MNQQSLLFHFRKILSNTQTTIKILQLSPKCTLFGIQDHALSLVACYSTALSLESFIIQILQKKFSQKTSKFHLMIDFFPLNFLISNQLSQNHLFNKT